MTRPAASRQTTDPASTAQGAQPASWDRVTWAVVSSVAVSAQASTKSGAKRS